MANKLEIAGNLLKVMFALGFGLLVVFAIADISINSSGRLLQAEDDTEAPEKGALKEGDNFIIFRLINLSLVVLMVVTAIRCYYREILSNKSTRQSQGIPLRPCACQVHQSFDYVQSGNPLPVHLLETNPRA